MSRSLSPTESGNSQSRYIIIRTSCGQRFVFCQVSLSRTSSVFFRKLEETHKRSLYFGLGERVSDSLSVRASSGIFFSVYLHEHRQERFSGSEDRKNVKERCNKNYATSSDSFSHLNICGSQKERASPSDKPEKSQSVNSLHSFQNEGLFLLNEKCRKESYVKSRSEGCIFYNL